jgi:hypothetical protein
MSRRIRRTTGSLFSLFAAAAASACTLEKKDDVGPFREAIPQAEAVKVDGPESVAGESRSRSGSSGLLAEEQSGSGDPAYWYAWTRRVRDGVNAITGRVLGSVWYIVHTEPSDVSSDEAIWGPYTDALEPVTWRFRVTRVGEQTYDYVLEGRPKVSTSDDAYRPVLLGRGYGKASEQHGDGSFTSDLDAARELDPVEHRDDSGSVKVTHDLPRDVTRRLNALPRVITAELRPAGEQSLTVKSTANEDGTGVIECDAFVDIDDRKATAPEDVTIVSRWRNSGAGRADITIANGDLPKSTPIVNAVECWGTDFTRVYYSDDAEFAPTEGDETACAYDAP